MADKPNLTTLKAVGREAILRARERANSARITDEAWHPEIQALQDRGWRLTWVAEALGLSERRVREINQAMRKKKLDLIERFGVEPDPKKLSDEVQELTEFNSRGFLKFYERFSGRTLPPHCAEWIDLFVEHRNLIVNLPPGHLKSTVYGVWLPIWLLCIDRDEQIIVMSKSRQLAIRNIREVEYNLSYNEDLIKTFGRFAPDRSGDVPWRPGQGELLIMGRHREVQSGDLSLQSRGMEQQILGMRATIVICDDVTDAKLAKSEIGHAEEMRKLHEEILNRIEPAGTTNAAGRATIVGQRVHFLDVYGELAEMEYLTGKRRGEKLFHVEKRPAVLDWEEEKVLWPEKWTFDELMLTYSRVGGYAAFECLYQQNPLPEGEAFVTAEWLARCYDRERVVGEGVSRGGLLPIVRVASLDPSPKNWNALVVADILTTKSMIGIVVLDILRWKGGTREFKLKTGYVLDTYAPDYFIVEQSTFLTWFEEEPLFQTLKSRSKFLAHHTGANKGDEEWGVGSLSGDFEDGRIRLPYGDDESRTVSKLLENEALVYPQGRFYDVLMALWFIKWNYKKLKPRIPKPSHFVGSGEPEVWSSWKIEAENARRQYPRKG